MFETIDHCDLRMGDGYILYWATDWAVWRVEGVGHKDVCRPVWNSTEGKVDDPWIDTREVDAHRTRDAVRLKAEHIETLLMALTIADADSGKALIQTIITDYVERTGNVPYKF